MLEQSLKQYGTVLHIENELYGDSSWSVPNGNVIVHMYIDEAIPTRINLAGYTIKVFGSSLERVCFFCGAKDHAMEKCNKDEAKNTADHQNNFKLNDKKYENEEEGKLNNCDSTESKLSMNQCTNLHNSHLEIEKDENKSSKQFESPREEDKKNRKKTISRTYYQ